MVSLGHRGLNVTYHFTSFHKYHSDVLIAFNSEGMSYQLNKQTIK